MTSLRTTVRIFGGPEIRSIAPTPDTRLRVFEVTKTIGRIGLFSSLGRAQIETKIDEPAVVQGSAGDLSRVVVELLSNAERTTPFRTVSHIRIELKADSELATL